MHYLKALLAMAIGQPKRSWNFVSALDAIRLEEIVTTPDLWTASGYGQGLLKVISSCARCRPSQCEHSPDVVAQFLLSS